MKPNKQMIRKHSLKGQHQVRPHLAYLNKRRVELAAQRPDLTVKERTRIAMEEFSVARPVVQRKLKKVRAKRQHKERKLITGETGWPDISDKEWPLSDAQLDAALSKRDCPKGVCRACCHLRGDSQSRLFVPDENHIPESEDMVLRRSCHQLHYGLCLESDKQVYKHALQVAADIEHWIKHKDESCGQGLPHQGSCGAFNQQVSLRVPLSPSETRNADNSCFGKDAVSLAF